MSRPPLHLRIADWFGRRAQQLGDAWMRLIAPIEGFFGRVGEGAMDSLDSFSGLEAAVIRIVQFIFWPVVAIGRLIGRLVPSSGPARGVFAAPAIAFGYLVGGFMWLATKLNLDGVIIWLVWLLQPIWRPAAMVLGFANAWLATRRPRELALAVPALLMVAPFVFVGYTGATQGPRQIAKRYRAAVNDALAAGESDKVRLYERKLAQLGIDTRRTDFRTAESLAEDGDLEGAYERMSSLASPETPGYAEAHAWIAEKLVAGELTDAQEPLLADEDQRVLLAERHLDRLEELGGAGLGVTVMRAFIYQTTDREDQAVEILSPYSRDALAAAAMRLRLLATLGRRDEARDQSADLWPLYAKQRDATILAPTDHQVAAMAGELLADDRKLESALEAWADSDPDDPQPREWLARVARRRYERLQLTRTANAASIAELLCEAARRGSSDRWISGQIDKIASRRTRDRTASRVWELLLANTEAPTQVRVLLAARAAGTGQIVEARRLFRSLIDDGHNSAIVWNNYGWTLLEEPEADPAAAVEACDRAVALRPADHRFRETRGQALVRLGSWDKALADLEYALNGMPESAEVHAALATVHEALDNPQLAALHRRQAGR